MYEPIMRSVTHSCRSVTHSCVRPVVLPAPAPGGKHHVRVLELAEAAVVAAEGAEIVAAFLVEVVAQDGAAERQVGAQMEQVAVRLADELDPERHHLHV